MGESHSVQKMQKAAEASADAAEKKMVDNLKLLQELGESKLKAFFDKIQFQGDKHKFALGMMLTQYSQICVLATNSAGPLKDAVSKVVSDVTNGDIGGLITTLVDTGIDAMFASSRGSVAEKQMYTVKLNGIGIERIDIYMYQYDISVSGLIAKKKSLFVYGYAISTIGQRITAPQLADIISVGATGAEGEDEAGKIRYDRTLYRMLAPIILSENVKHRDELKLD